MANKLNITAYLLPTGGIYYSFTQVTFRIPVVVPAEPVIKPAPVIVPEPDEDDPWNVPAPKINPTPKGLSFLSFE